MVYLLIRLATCVSVVMLALHLVGMALAAWRSRPMAPMAAAPDAPGVTLVRPCCGIDFDGPRILAATFDLNYPCFEILFCVDRAEDPVIPLIRDLIAQHPHVDAQVLVGVDAISPNPKLNNMTKGWRAAKYEWVCFTDSNLLVPPDYLQRILSQWDDETGCVSAPPVGGHAQGLFGELECAFLNSFQARWQFAVDTLGFGFAQGKTLFFRKADLAQAGGMLALAQEPAEDAAATKVVRGMGKGVRLVDPPFVQPLGRRTLKSVWNRQVRWARLRRATFPGLYIPELLTGAVVPVLATAASAYLQDLPVGPIAGAYIGTWYTAEAALVWFAGWQFTKLTPISWLLRDAMLPALWIAGLAGRDFVWRGDTVQRAVSTSGVQG